MVPIRSRGIMIWLKSYGLFNGVSVQLFIYYFLNLAVIIYFNYGYSLFISLVSKFDINMKNVKNF